jgi:hypothetical protein
MGRRRKNGARYPSGKLKHANCDMNGEPVDAVAKWARQARLVEEQVLDPRWGSQVGRLNRFHYLSDQELGACFRWADIQRRAMIIRGIPSPNVRAFSYDPTDHVNGEPPARPVTNGEKGALDAANNARKAVIREASQAALEALWHVALCDRPPGGTDQLWHLRSGARVLARYWGGHKR